MMDAVTIFEHPDFKDSLRSLLRVATTTILASSRSAMTA
jgi:hypothetical protein